jgi:hypothetical protein
MQVDLEIPEALTLEGIRSAKLSVSQARRLPGISSGYEMDVFVKEHAALPALTFGDVRRDSDIAIAMPHPGYQHRKSRTPVPLRSATARTCSWRSRKPRFEVPGSALANCRDSHRRPFISPMDGPRAKRTG